MAVKFSIDQSSQLLSEIHLDTFPTQQEYHSLDQAPVEVRNTANNAARVAQNAQRQEELESEPSNRICANRIKTVVTATGIIGGLLLALYLFFKVQFEDPALLS